MRILQSPWLPGAAVRQSGPSSLSLAKLKMNPCVLIVVLGAGWVLPGIVPPARAATPSVAGIAQKSMPAVVNISTKRKPEPRAQHRRQFPPMPGPFGPNDPFEEFFRRFGPRERPPSREQRSVGSGFIISQDGYIVTNNHVIDGADTIIVRMSDEEEYEAAPIGTDEKTDLALIKIEPRQPLPSVPFGQSANLEVGNWVIAIGNPFGLSQTVTIGIVSAKGRVIGAGPYDNFIQTDASINPGNSGGPLLNLQGEVIGVNTAIYSRRGGNIGIGFAIPIDLAKSVVQQLREKGSVTRGWLGVMIQSVTPELAKSFDLADPKGALVAEVTPDSPAHRAGLERGDIIVAFNQTEIANSRDLPALVAQTPVGTQATIGVLRGGKSQTLAVTLGELKDERQTEITSGKASPGNWGMTVTDLTPEIRRRLQLEAAHNGVVVSEVDPGSAASRAGIRRGDIIQEVNRRAVASVRDFMTIVSEMQDQDRLLLLIRRSDFTSFFALRRED